jgi:hypothetical protein
MGWYPKWFKQQGGGKTAALLHGAGLSSNPVLTSQAGKNFLGYWLKSSASSGDTRGLYMRLYLSGAGAGEAIRAFATVQHAQVATGGTVNGMHASLGIDAGYGVSGAGNAARFTLGAAAESRSLTGTLAAVQLDSDLGAGNTPPATAAFLRVTDTGAVKLGKLLNIPAPSNSTIFATHTTQTMTHSIRIVDENGTPYFIMCTNAATNRGGGS